MSAQPVTLKANDGHRLSAWKADPDGNCKGGVVVLHAVYGSTAHMGDVCSRWAQAGYRAVESVKVSAFHRRFSIVPDGGVRVRIGPVTAKEPDIWHMGYFT